MINSQQIFEDARRDAAILENQRWREKQVSDRVVAQILANRRIRERETAQANNKQATNAKAQDEADEALAESIFWASRGSGMRSREIGQPPNANQGKDADFQFARKTETRVTNQTMGDEGLSDDDLADQIFAAGGGKTGFERFSPSSDDGDDEDEALAQELFELSC